MFKVAVLVGSLRRDSINRKLALALEKLAAPRLELSRLELADLPMFNEDLLSPDIPLPVARMKKAITAADAVLFVSPEYNRGPTAVIKNVIDWGSRPWGTNSWANKPGALAGMSLGALGTAVAQATLRTSLIALDVRLLGQPEIYLTYKEGLFDSSYAVTDERIATLLKSFIDRFAAWITTVKG
jgi:chromate reductase, NAD(P)H dehydrogenase (quinone)